MRIIRTGDSDSDDDRDVKRTWARARVQEIANIGPEAFSEFGNLNKEGLALVVFSRDSCPKCSSFKPTLELFRAQMQHVSVFRVDTNAEPTLAPQFGITGVPTSILFVNGAPSPPLVGDTPLHALISYCNQNSQPLLSETQHLRR